MTADETTGTVADWAPVSSIVEAHARRIPDALAVEAQGKRRSYAELMARINVLAARIARRLHNGERVVGVCLSRDIDLPAWLLAIHKVGAAYWPIDPTTPPARLAHMVEDARPALIVVSRCYTDVVAGIDAPIIVAEDKEEDVPPAPVFAVRPETLAYVIFTSGSTGRPKGVEIEHRSLVALMAAMAVSPGFLEGERLLALTRISFDLSVPDLFLPFFAGGCLALVDLEVAADPEQLAAAFEVYRPDVVQGTPSTWRTLLEAGWQGLPRLRILTGGEPVTRPLVDRLIPCCAEIWNMYGPTEATVWATSARVTAGEGPVPIGWPSDGVIVQVADDKLMQLPAGEVGEIVIGGVGVARGYRNRPDLTAERFVALADGTRAYRTGDLGRVDENSALHCLGRLDDQVKIRGFRIELGDVEAALAGHWAVAWCAAKVWVDPLGDTVLVGYIVPRKGPAASVRDVMSFLATQIAPYMIPDRIVTVAVMPLTPNGKVDRAALPDPFAGPRTLPDSQAGNSIQARLATIWSELLNVAPIAGEDDFFELGGYSLMTVRLTRRIEHEFGIRLALVELMKYSTLAAMAARIRHGEVSSVGVMLLNAGGSRPPIYWLDAGPLMRTMTRGLSSDQPAFALNTDEADEDALGGGDLSIPAIAARLKVKLLADHPSGPYYLGGWCRWGIVAYELAQQLIEDGETVALLVLLDAQRPGCPPRRAGLRTRVGRWLRSPASPVSDEPLSFSQRVEIATRTYLPGHYPGDVLLLRPTASRGDAGWRSVVDRDLVVEHTPGDHESMVRGENVRFLAATLDRALYVAQREEAANPTHTLSAPEVQAARATFP